MSEEAQYVVLGIILLVCVAFIAKKFIRTKDKNSSGCCGCPLKDGCKKDIEDCH